MSLFKASDETDTITPEGVGTVSETFDTDISADDEFDVTEAGIPNHSAVAQIGLAKIDTKPGEAELPDRWINVPFTLLNSPHVERKVTINTRFWLRHSNEVASRIGQSQFKSLTKAAIGKTAGNAGDLEGTYVAVQVSGDTWPQVKNFKPVNEDDLNEALASAGVGELT